MANKKIRRSIQNADERTHRHEGNHSPRQTSSAIITPVTKQTKSRPHSPRSIQRLDAPCRLHALPAFRAKPADRWFDANPNNRADRNPFHAESTSI
jgi:hypothetical protein